MGEGDEVDVGAVEHQLHADEDADGVALGGHADDAAHEQHGAEQQIVFEAECRSCLAPPLFGTGQVGGPDQDDQQMDGDDFKRQQVGGATVRCPPGRRDFRMRWSDGHTPGSLRPERHC